MTFTPFPLPASPMHRSLVHWILEKFREVLLRLESCRNFLYSSTLPVFLATAWKHNRIMESTKGNGVERWMPGVESMGEARGLIHLSTLVSRPNNPVCRTGRSVPYFLLPTIFVTATRRALCPPFSLSHGCWRIQLSSVIIYTLLQISATL